ncbi:maleylpyruvate isomerase family mycothiol-dependent enzyme [Nocardia cyriacigeorgica]|uniref:maleylpyruvate isomerase family mycothiol-dependent enzyme n=1 Tax=Nocardia cyriacigeorgica TaxID=135487 RepID=UPI0013D2FECE|nr:maleylpyruvate isomerase family mycothiol-dependent enzyme [Nocardia cyriacigeorgica]NEW29453.1 maleylpyruvate isomerase family mycothiol-dependent enzyme [Nocardia cyriacigeorgica]
MDPDLISTWLRAERLAFADFFDELSDDEWQRESLCAGWTIHDVLAHITSVDSLGSTLMGLIRARGNWDRMNADAARRVSARYAPAELIAQLRAAAGSSRRSPGAAPADPLVDVIVHEQDVARPLGRTLHTPPPRVVAALDHVLASRFYGARKRLRGLRLTATDADWSYGDGPEQVRAPAIDLLLLATGREVARS